MKYIPYPPTCGVDFVEVVDTYAIKAMTKLLKKATEYVNSSTGGIAVIIARHPCVIAYPKEAIPERTL